MKTKITLLLAFACFFTGKTQTLQWAHSFGNSGTEVGRSVTTDAAGNVYTTGTFGGIIDFDPGPGTFTINGVGGAFFISKLDAAGNFIWAKHLNGSASIYAQSIAVDAAGNVYTAGGFDGSADFDPGTPNVILTSSGNTDAFVSKLDAAGNYVWAKTLSGVSSTEYAYSIALDATGDVYVTGSFNGTNSDFDPSAASYTLSSAGSYDAFISKLTSAGNFVWAKNIGGGIADYGRSIKVDASNNVYTTGYYQTTSDFDPSSTASYTLTATGMNDIYVSKLDASGNFVWAKSMGSTANDWGYGLDLDASGNVYTTGSFQNTGDFDPGVGTFSLNFGGIFISKLNNGGNFIWAKQLAGNGSYGEAIDVDATGNVFTTGRYNSGDFDPGVGTVNLNAVGGSDIFISQLDPSGNYVWAGTAGDIGTDIAYSINVNNNAIHITGYYNVAGDFDPTAGTFTLTPVGGYDVFVLKLLISPTGVTEQSNDFNAFSISPNPSNGEFNLNLKEELSGELIVTDVMGKEIFKQELNGAKEIELKLETKGLYFVRLESEGKRMVKKVVVE